MRKISILLLLATVLMMFSGCQQAEPVDLKVGYLSGPTALTILQMAYDNPVIADNVTINYEMVTSPSVMTGKLTASEVDMAVIATNQAAMLFNNGVEYQIASPSVWGVLYLIGKSDIANIADLAGKEIALIGQGLTPDIIVRHVLMQNGINPDEDVDLVYLSSPQELLQSMLMGRYELAVMPEPLASTAKIKNAELKGVLDFQEEWANITGKSSYPQSSLVVRKAFADANPEVVNSFLAAYEQSIDWANNNAETLGQYAEELEIGLQAAVVKKALPACNLRYISATDAKSDIETYLQAIYDIMPNAVGGAMPSNSFYFDGK